MKKKIHYAIVLVCLLLGLIPQSDLAGQAVSPSQYAEAIREFEKFAADQMAYDRIPGLSIAFLKGDFVWARGFGHADLENMVPAKPDSSFRMASVTKTFTAFAVLQLAEAGRINLDAEIQTYVPYFPRKKWPMTIRQLLGHLAGISHYRNSAAEEHIKEPKNTREAIAIFQDFDLVAEPGTHYNYSTYGYNLLGAVVEAASGQSYGDYLKSHVFEPLGMDNSRLDNPADIIPNRIRGYRIEGGFLKNSEYVDVSSRFAGGGTRSTVLDLIKYARGIMDGKLLSERRQREMFTSMATRGGSLTGYGMGWSVQPWKGHFQVFHSGSQPETRTYLMIFPTEKFAAAAASNLEGSNPAAYVKRLAELVLDEDLDSAAYAPDRNKQAAYNALEKVFNYGLSDFDWNGQAAGRDEKDIPEAIRYFNSCVDENALRLNYLETKKKITAGIHPVAHKPFIKLGSAMASVLKESFGEEKLRAYRKSGPVSFFSDYMTAVRTRAERKRWPAFSPEFTRLVSGWEKDWKKTYTDYVRSLAVTPSTNFEEIQNELQKEFSGALFYKDFSEEFGSAARFFFEKGDTAKALSILKISRDLYPGSPAPYAALGASSIWAGDFKAGRQNYKKAFEIDPTHPQLSLDQNFSFVNQMRREKKMKEALELCLILLGYFPKDARIYVETGNSYALAGQREKAIELYRKALEIDPNQAAAKANLEKLEKIK